MIAHVYVYYRVTTESRESADTAVSRLFAEVSARTGVAGRIMRREDDPGTWMEVYESVGDTAAFCATLARLSAAVGLDAILGGAEARHIERFVEPTPCA